MGGFVGAVVRVNIFQIVEEVLFAQAFQEEVGIVGIEGFAGLFAPEFFYYRLGCRVQAVNVQTGEGVEAPGFTL